MTPLHSPSFRPIPSLEISSKDQINPAQQPVINISDISKVLEVAQHYLDYSRVSVFMDFDWTTAFLYRDCTLRLPNPRQQRIYYDELAIWTKTQCWNVELGDRIRHWAFKSFTPGFVEDKTQEVVLQLMDSSWSFLWLSRRTHAEDLTKKHIEQLTLPKGTITPSSPHGFVLTNELSKGEMLKRIYRAEILLQSSEVILHIDDNPEDAASVADACKALHKPALIFHYSPPRTPPRQLSNDDIADLLQQHGAEILPSENPKPTSGQS